VNDATPGQLVFTEAARQKLLAAADVLLSRATQNPKGVSDDVLIQYRRWAAVYEALVKAQNSGVPFDEVEVAGEAMLLVNEAHDAAAAAAKEATRSTR
jgi:hypothetical protein